MTTCEYCGKPNEFGAAQCASCGTPLPGAASVERPKKSKVLAVTLALIFGPLGLLYLGMEGAVVFLSIAGVSIFLVPMFLSTHNQGMGLLISLLARVASVWYALTIFARGADTGTNELEAETLLDEAVALENEDFEQAIAKYQEVTEKYPDSRASQAAQTCIKTLRSKRG